MHQRGKSRSPQGRDNNAVPSFNHQEGVCGTDVTASGETHHHVAAAAAMCALPPSLCTEATLKRPGGPREGPGLTSLRRRVPPQGRAACWPPEEIPGTQHPARGVPPRPPQAQAPGTCGIFIPIRTGPMADRSMGTLVPTGPTVAPGPMMGTLAAMGACEASWAQSVRPAQYTWRATAAPRAPRSPRR